MKTLLVILSALILSSCASTPMQKVSADDCHFVELYAMNAIEGRLNGTSQSAAKLMAMHEAASERLLGINLAAIESVYEQDISLLKKLHGGDFFWPCMVKYGPGVDESERPPESDYWTWKAKQH